MNTNQSTSWIKIYDIKIKFFEDWKIKLWVQIRKGICESPASNKSLYMPSSNFYGI